MNSTDHYPPKADPNVLKGFGEVSWDFFLSRHSWLLGGTGVKIRIRLSRSYPVDAPLMVFLSVIIWKRIFNYAVTFKCFCLRWRNIRVQWATNVTALLKWFCNVYCLNVTGSDRVTSEKFWPVATFMDQISIVCKSWGQATVVLFTSMSSSAISLLVI